MLYSLILLEMEEKSSHSLIHISQFFSFCHFCTLSIGENRIFVHRMMQQNEKKRNIQIFRRWITCISEGTKKVTIVNEWVSEINWDGVLLCLANRTVGGGVLFRVAFYYRVAFYFGGGVYTLFWSHLNDKIICLPLLHLSIAFVKC